MTELVIEKLVDNGKNKDKMNKTPRRTEYRRRRNETKKLLDLIRGTNNVNNNNIVPVARLVLNNDRVDELFDNIDPQHSDSISISDLETSLGFSSSKENENVTNISLNDSLRIWATTHNVTHTCVRDLIKILNPHVNNILPEDPRTLLKTPRNIQVQKVSGGDFVYFGIMKGITRRLSQNLSDCEFPIISKLKSQLQIPILSISVGIDGVPISSSNTKSFWPILGILDQVKNSSPFIIGLFCGMSKPYDTKFMEDFINEANELEIHGIDHGLQKFAFRVSCLVADAPARSFLKSCKQHNSYDSCERCVQEGEWLGRVILTQTNCQLRTDDSFRAQADADHHTGTSNLIRLSLGPVSQVVLDHMHLVFLGITKKLLRTWVMGKLGHKLCSRDVLSISRKLLQLRPYVPKEFQRKPRALSELAHFKATEYRFFLLYSGIVVLKDVLPINKYKHFLKFHAAMHILLSKIASNKQWNDLARSLIIQFVQEAQNIYGSEFLIYNVHSLIHICDDAMNFGNLSNVSAFPFENYMQTLKKMLKAKNFQVNQVAKRIEEKESIVHERMSYDLNVNILFTKYKYHNCYCINDGSFVLLKDFTSPANGDFYVLDKVEKFPDYPFSSLFIDIFVAKLSHNIVNVNINEVKYKCLLLPYQNMYVCIPLLHCWK